jgi:hypothetical protein
MVRSAASRVSNHEAPVLLILRDAAKWSLLRMRPCRVEKVNEKNND